MAEKKTLPLKHGGTHLAYITDEEEKILRDLFHSKETDPEVKYFNGIPVLQGDQQEMREQAAAQKLYNKQKAAGWKTVNLGEGESAWLPPAKKKTVEKTTTKKVATKKKTSEKVVTKKAVVKNSAVPTADDYRRTVSGGGEQVADADQSGGNYLDYVLTNPDLRENAEALGLTQSEMAEWGETHWNEWGSRTIESRGNTPFATVSPSARYAEWELGENVPIIYAGQTIEDILQNSIRSQYRGADVDDYEMWESREQIAPAWNQGQFTGQGWNMAADQPYGTGILADQIEVNRDIGQLVPTTAAGNVGDLRFLQDRYVDASIANDFPVGWTTPENTWAAAAPQQLGNYWDVLTNATRTPEGILRRAADYDPLTAVGPSVSPGPRGGGNVRGGPTGTGTGVGTTGTTGTGGGILGNIPFQDWSRFMPTETPYYQLGEFAGAHYQPWATGTPQGSAGMGGGAGGFAGPDTWATGGGGGTTATGGPGPINPNIWGNTDTTGSGNTVTDAQGKTWIMSNGQWIPADSELGSILASGDTPRHPLGMYDSRGRFVGSEGGGALEAGVAMDKYGQPIGQPVYGGGPLWDAAGNPQERTKFGANVVAGGSRDAGRAFIGGLGNVVGALTNPYGIVGKFNTDYQNAFNQAKTNAILSNIAGDQGRAGQDGVSLDADFDADQGFYE